MELNLKGRTVLITGASRGIGKSIAKVLAGEGCNLILTATDTAKLAQLAADLNEAHGVKVESHGFDLSKHENIKALADVAGHCDILVNNAGAIPRGSLQEVTPEAWRQGWDLKVFGYIDLTRCILPRMTERKSGVIINIVGMAGERPEPKYIATCCGNAALIMFTQCLGGESMRDGVRIVAINPGPICPIAIGAAPNGSPSVSLAARTAGRNCTNAFQSGVRAASTRWPTWLPFSPPIAPPISAARSFASTPA